jgi:lysine biosynthesis protein LysW
MNMVICPVCGADIELELDVKEGDAVVCPVCGVSLRVFLVDDTWQAEEAD